MGTDTIRNKLAELDKQKEKIIAQLNAVLGAQQVLRELLADAEKEAEPDE